MKAIIIFMLTTVMIAGCSRQQEDNDVSVEWELISNLPSGKGGSKAVFRIINHNSDRLRDTSWALFFSMAPRNILPDHDAKATVKHINGDWYKLVPHEGFSIKKGKYADIQYHMDWSMIKKSDAPCGLYFVFYDDYGNGEEVIPVNDYTIRPFIREEQVRRSADDREPLPFPSAYYEKYNRSGRRAVHAFTTIPSPFKLTGGDESVIINEDFAVYHNSKELGFEAAYLVHKLSELAGINISVSDTGKNARSIDLVLKTDNIHDEGYVLESTGNNITIKGSKTGIFYGIQSLLNMITYEDAIDGNNSISIPEITIADSPRFSYRGMHIDVCRNFQKKEQILKVIDLMAMYKMNTLHLYLTEDEGWRIAIRSLPELTQTGSRRGHTKDEFDCLQPSYGSGPFADSENNYGTGFYTRDDFIAIIQYAHERHIRVIPSINLPGHARAAIKSMEARYRRLKTEGKEKEAEEYRLIDPDDRSVYSSAQFYNDNVVCVARESVYHFFETVVDEVISMYREAGVPVRVIHTGGDEVPEGVWEKSPLCNALAEKLSGNENLQQYFFTRINNILSEKGLSAAGWQEVIMDGQALSKKFTGKDLTVHAWSNLWGSQDLAYRIANEGYKVVLSPVSNLYLDLAYDNHPLEPGLYWGGFTDERKPWEFAPFNLFITTNKTPMGEWVDTGKEYSGMERIKPEARENISGLQGQLWHETIRGGEMLEYYLLPKIISLAERCWAKENAWEDMDPSETRNQMIEDQWAIFAYNLYNKELPKLSLLNKGYNYRVPPPGAIVEDGMVKVNVAGEGLTVKYTTNGSDPDQSSDVYFEPIPAEGKIKLQCFDKAGKGSRVVVPDTKDVIPGKRR